MKYVFLVLIQLFIFQVTAQTVKDWFVADSTVRFPKELTADSGVFNRDEAYKYLLKLVKDKSLIELPEFADKNEVWGKYYTIPSSKKKIVCLEVMPAIDFEFHLLLELDEKGLIRALEPYFHGNYSCCWTNFDGFFRFGEGVAFRACGTGSGFCDASRYLFQRVAPQDSLVALQENLFSSMEGDDFYEIRSDWKCSADSVFIDYTYVSGKLFWIEESQSYQQEPLKQETSNYSFPLVNGTIYISDESELPTDKF